MAQKQVFILNTRIDSTTPSRVLVNIGKKLASKAKKDKFYVVTPNPEIVLAAHKDSELQKIINEADFSIPDGVGLKIFGNRELEIYHGRKLMLDLFELANSRKLKVFFVTSNLLDTKEKLLTRLKQEYPNIQAKAAVGPRVDSSGNPVVQVDIKLQIDLVNLINNFQPHLLFVCFGAGKQEKWIAHNLQRLNVRGAIGVGGALDYYAGTKPLPPRWMEQLELEWLWRLFNEPGHIKRVFKAVIVFPFAVLLSKIR